VRYNHVLAVSCSIVLLVGFQFSSASNALPINEAATKAAINSERVEVEIGIAQNSRPLSIVHDPPSVLTQGDEISLPILLRNYLKKTQTVDVEMNPEQWFEVTGSARRQIKVAPGEIANAVIYVRATAPVENGKQRVTVTSDAFSDTVEKRVTVHPDGEEKTITASHILGDTTTIEMNIPTNAIKDSPRVELKIYPNLMAHVTEGIEAILKRPYGCAEQTISSTYPSILILRYYKQRGEDFPPVAQQARLYLQEGYTRLLTYRTPQGGFSYWEKGDADLALTAYALRFLNDAREFIAVDESVIEGAHNWIIRQQNMDGYWETKSSSHRIAPRRPDMLTAFIARVLAATESKKTVKANDDQKVSISLHLSRALDYLTQLVPSSYEPYFLASYALAAVDANQMERAAKAIIRLRACARQAVDTNYWMTEAHTPFNGWGLPAYIETTALAVQALASAASKEQQNGKDSAAKNDEMISRSLLFLLRQKDRYGVWYSTQTTVNALEALTAVLPIFDTKEKDDSKKRDDVAEIIINEELATKIEIPRGHLASNPLMIDISSSLLIGNNRIEIRRAAGSDKVTTQIVATYYVPWPVLPDKALADKKEATGPIKLRVSFDKTDLRIGEEVTCDVSAERASNTGYGMMLAEIGLPPGADVDRVWLNRAMRESDWGLDRYDVLPDKLVVYLWPRTGKSQFQFKFRPRFGIYAKTAPSVIYDYYNPEARAVVAPTKFSVY
jgi:uncharacterized protein YfaS (alpha-2-macroglobulin family)